MRRVSTPMFNLSNNAGTHFAKKVFHVSLTLTLYFVRPGRMSAYVLSPRKNANVASVTRLSTAIHVVPNCEICGNGIDLGVALNLLLSPSPSSSSVSFIVASLMSSSSSSSSPNPSSGFPVSFVANIFRAKSSAINASSSGVFPSKPDPDVNAAASASPSSSLSLSSPGMTIGASSRGSVRNCPSENLPPMLGTKSFDGFLPSP
mmetsp:Transcript_5270/g.19185  ORF Transcript_5270/g.19185 Transcript_5270/m.19185 type:complete len:204 (+) Transcript_5270:1633-2244(+)